MNYSVYAQGYYADIKKKNEEDLYKLSQNDV